jgi:hypothetical protein
MSATVGASGTISKRVAVVTAEANFVALRCPGSNSEGQFRHFDYCVSSYINNLIGGAKGSRTPDLLNAIPILKGIRGKFPFQIRVPCEHLSFTQRVWADILLPSLIFFYASLTGVYDVSKIRFFTGLHGLDL